MNLSKLVCRLSAFIFFLFFFVQKTIAQVPDYIQRDSKTSGSPQVDVANKAIILKPNFTWSALDGKYYETFLKNDEIVVDWPKDGQIFQRQNDNTGWVYVAGKCKDLTVDSVLISAKVVQGGTNKTKKIAVDANGNFEGAILLTGGDYLFTISEYYANGTYLPLQGRNVSIYRVGVGEVLLVWGHSFMQGDTIGVGSADPRARTVRTVRLDTAYHNFYFENIQSLPVDFHQIDENQLGPFNEKSWIFGPLADTLVKRLNVPVLIYSSAFGGSNIYQNKQNITNQPFGYTWFADGAYQNNGFPFKSVQAAFQRYINNTGVRGVIVAHGVNDSNNDYNGGNVFDFQSNYEFVINRIRTVEANNSPNLPFIISFEPTSFTDINNQIQSIVDNDPNTFPGIDLRDPATYGPWRDDGYGVNQGHYHGIVGLTKYLELWKNVITPTFFTDTTPKQAEISSNLKVN